MKKNILAISALAILLTMGIVGVQAEKFSLGTGDSVGISGLQVAVDADAEIEKNRSENKSRDERREGIKEKVEQKREAAKERVENKTGERINQGRLFKEVQQIRKEQFKITKALLRSINYTGPMDEFATAYNQELNELKVEIRAKIESGNTTDLNMRVVRNLAEERLIKARTDTFAKLNITVDNVTAEFAKHLNDKQKLEVLRADIRGTSPKFRLHVYAVMKNGTPEEQAALKAQLEAYAASINGTVKKVQVKEVKISKVRAKLNKNERVLPEDVE